MCDCEPPGWSSTDIHPLGFGKYESHSQCSGGSWTQSQEDVLGERYVSLPRFLYSHALSLHNTHTHTLEQEANSYVPSGVEPCQVALFSDH